MNPDLPTPTDPHYQNLVKKLAEFYHTEVPPDQTGLSVKRHAEQLAKEIMAESLDMFEKFAQSRSAIAKYDLLKWIGNKKQEVRLYK